MNTTTPSRSKQHSILPTLWRVFGLTVSLGLILFSHAIAGNIQVNARINQDHVFVGQPFRLIISVEGADDVTPPDLSNIKGVQIKALGQQSNSSTQIVINGRQIESTKNIELSYQVIVSDKSTATIPALTVIADGVAHTTKPIHLSIKEPEKNEHFKLEVRLSKPTAYVGEPLLMTTTWLISQQARGGAFNLPILSDPRFKTSNREDLLPRDQKQLIKIELDGEVILAKRYQKRVGGKDFVAITFFHNLIPKTTGNLTLPQGTIAIDALAGYETPRSRRDYDPFGMLGSRQREIYKTLVVPANQVALTVLPLPKQDVPPSFSGLVGKYTIKSHAEPTTVNVGDPITLNLEITGETAGITSMPPLNLPHFKISNDPAKKTSLDDKTTFTTTIRARDEKVKEIPAIPLSFFNVDTGQYETAETTAIPIRVRATRIITAADALGTNKATVPQEEKPREQIPQGIHYNYSDIKPSLSSQTSTLFIWLALTVPVIFFVLVVLVKRDGNKTGKDRRLRKKRALRQLKKDLARGNDGFTAWLVFLGNELDRQPHTITIQDVLPHLPNHSDLHGQTREIFQKGEAMKYGRTSLVLSDDIILETARRLHEVL